MLNLFAKGEECAHQDYTKIQELLTQWLNDYSLKIKSESDEVWLANKLKKELPQLSDDKCIEFSSDTIATLKIYNDKKESLHIAISKGMAQESWLEKELEASSKGMNAIQYGTYLSSIDTAISEANKDLAQTIITRDGNINNNPNLFGYLFESEHVASFNMDAALKGSDYRAEVLRPVLGTNYEKNSADIAIFDKKEQQYNLYRLNATQTRMLPIKLLKLEIIVDRNVLFPMGMFKMELVTQNLIKMV